MNLIDRSTQKTPKFFKKLQKASLLVTGIAAAILTSPVALPALIVSFAGYLATAGAVSAALSQITVASDLDQ